MRIRRRIVQVLRDVLDTVESLDRGPTCPQCGEPVCPCVVLRESSRKADQDLEKHLVQAHVRDVISAVKYYIELEDEKSSGSDRLAARWRVSMALTKLEYLTNSPLASDG